MPKVSIILPVYNCERYVALAIQSVLDQTFQNFELIAINDGSTDGSLSVMQKFNDPRIKVIDQKNQGLIATLNTGLTQAKAELIGRIDADDIWTDKNKLQTQVEYLDAHPDCAIVGTWAKVIDQDGKITGSLAYPAVDTEIRENILIKNCFIHPSVVFRKNIAIQAGGFNKDEVYVEDYGLWLRMGQFGKFANIPEQLMSYRVHSGSVTQRKNLVQSQNSFELIKIFKPLYPNYYKAWCKWQSKIWLRRLGVRI